MKQSLENIKIAYLGTPEISALVLEGLLDAGFNVSSVFCAPDKPSGRGKKIIVSPVKSVAQKFKIPIFQPKNKEELETQIKKLHPDIIIVFSFGMILPKEVINFPKYKTINIHPSLLPKFRGPSPVVSAILNGEKETGISIIQMIERIDAGPILAQKKIKIDREDTARSLEFKLAKLAKDTIIHLLPKWILGKIKEIPQDEKKATYTRIFKKIDGKINWERSAKEILNQIKAFTPWPGSYTFWQNNNKKLFLIIKEADYRDTNISSLRIGEVFLDQKKDLAVKTKKGYLVIKKLQLEGKRELSAQEFIRGYSKIVGSILN